MGADGAPPPLEQQVAGLTFHNPILLAAGTAAYGRDLAGVMQLEALGGLVTKAVSPEPRKGAAAPRVAEFPGGMINAVGLANPGLEAVAAEHLPWLATHVTRPRIVVNVVGSAIEDFGTVVARLTGERGVDAFELNVSCPNVRAGGMEFGADPASLAAVVREGRRATTRPIFVKLSPTLPDIAASARIAADAGADGVTLVNTLPGLLIDVERRRPALGFGTGGVSGGGLLPIGLLATWKVRRALPTLPIIGVGGVSSVENVVQYLLAGASLVGIGTAALRDPRLPERVAVGLADWCRAERVSSVRSLVGGLEF